MENDRCIEKIGTNSAIWQAKEGTSSWHSVHKSTHCKSCTAVLFHFQIVESSVSGLSLLRNNFLFGVISD